MNIFKDMTISDLEKLHAHLAGANLLMAKYRQEDTTELEFAAVCKPFANCLLLEYNAFSAIIERTKKGEVTRVKAYESMKAKHTDEILLFSDGDFYISFADDAKQVSEILGIILTRTSAKDITAQQAAFPVYALDTYLPRLVRAGKRIAICDGTNVVEKVEPAKKATH